MGIFLDCIVLILGIIFIFCCIVLICIYLCVVVWFIFEIVTFLVLSLVGFVESLMILLSIVSSRNVSDLLLIVIVVVFFER